MLLFEKIADTLDDYLAAEQEKFDKALEKQRKEYLDKARKSWEKKHPALPGGRRLSQEDLRGIDINNLSPVGRHGDPYAHLDGITFIKPQNAAQAYHNGLQYDHGFKGFASRGLASWLFNRGLDKEEARIFAKGELAKDIASNARVRMMQDNMAHAMKLHKQRMSYHDKASAITGAGLGALGLGGAYLLNRPTSVLPMYSSPAYYEQDYYH